MSYPFFLETKSIAPTRDDLVAATRHWLGTPYVHQATARGAGCDCLGLVRGVYRDIYGYEPEVPPPYSPDWNEKRSSKEPLLSAAQRHLNEVDAMMPKKAQVFVFRILMDGPAKHCGIISGDTSFIHAYAGRAVIESWLSDWWLRRVVGVFEFPGVT